MKVTKRGIINTHEDPSITAVRHIVPITRGLIWTLIKARLAGKALVIEIGVTNTQETDEEVISTVKVIVPGVCVSPPEEGQCDGISG